MRRFLAHIDIEKKHSFNNNSSQIFNCNNCDNTMYSFNYMSSLSYLLYTSPPESCISMAVLITKPRALWNCNQHDTHQVVPQNVDWSVHIHGHLNKTWTYFLSASWTTTSIFGLLRIHQQNTLVLVAAWGILNQLGSNTSRSKRIFKNGTSFTTCYLGGTWTSKVFLFKLGPLTCYLLF